MKAVMGWLVAYLFRWVPHAQQAGLEPVGTPDAHAPVIVTCNFSLTVKRVRRALKGCNVWLLVAPSNGINVWCAACGGIFTHNRVIDAIKVSGLAEKVRHRHVILPALSAPAMDRKRIREATGFQTAFGPVRARSLPEYLDRGMEKTEAMRTFPFGLRHRLDMLLSMNVPIYLLPAVFVAIFAAKQLLFMTLLFWFAVAVLYLFLDWIPGKTGWAKSLFAAASVVIVWAAFDWIHAGNPLEHWGWFPAVFGIFFAVGFDLAGIASARPSDAEALVARLGIRKLGSLYNEKALGAITLDRDRCVGCRTCWDICPVRVYGEELDADRKIAFRDASACFRCGACTRQCPEQALRIGV